MDTALRRATLMVCAAMIGPALLLTGCAGDEGGSLSTDKDSGSEQDAEQLDAQLSDTDLPDAAPTDTATPTDTTTPADTSTPADTNTTPDADTASPDTATPQPATSRPATPNIRVRRGCAAPSSTRASPQRPASPTRCAHKAIRCAATRGSAWIAWSMTTASVPTNASPTSAWRRPNASRPNSATGRCATRTPACVSGV